MSNAALRDPHYPLDNYELVDRYRRESGRVLLTGTQALVRIPLMQRTLDHASGLNTAGFVSGYRGSPLGMVDQELWRAKRFLDENNIEFLPAVNEDLAATAILGSQQVETDPGRTVDGVFGIWYGKGPGVDRAGDALKHGNAYGSSPHGGVLVVAGDDHGCISSSMPHQSDVAFLTFMMPHLNPASVAEFLGFGLYGIALSRFSGMWVGFKAITETVESAMSVELPPYPQFRIPADFTPPATGLHYRWPDFPGPQIEERLEAKKAATLAFAAANPVDRKIFDVEGARYGIVTTGKGHLDLMESLRLLGIDADEARRIGIDIYKVGMVWPLEPQGALDFVQNKNEVLVVEEKRGIIESQFKEYFYDYPGRKPQRMVGKADENGERLVPWVGELSPLQLAPIVAKRLDREFGGQRFSKRAQQLLQQQQGNVIEIGGAKRIPYFCSGCPHNTSTRVPEGSRALAGIGCHFMASWMDRDTDGLIQMGGEGVNWIPRSKFNGGQHVFQNLGDGTFYHSGSLAIRQAVAAKTNITYKILYNDAVAMTGGQPVDGPVSIQSIAHAVRAEGVQRIALVSDEPELFDRSDFPAGTSFSHRRDMDAVQRELRDIAGVTVLIYAQTCATEKRRRRKRGKMSEPKKRVVINDLVCEGCGDCSVESNCLSVVPKETPFGRKRQIDQNSCNKDFSCLNGFCPSFVTIEGDAARKRPGATDDADYESLFAALPSPQMPELEECFDVLVTGVGGTGVITVGALITMAAHLEGKGASELDFMGFAQKFGPVLSYLRIASKPSGINQVRIEPAQADALIGCDLVVSSSPKASITYQRNKTRAVVNSSEMMTGDFVKHRDANLRGNDRVAAIGHAIGEDNLSAIDANALAEKLMGDTIYANVIMLGAAWQSGLVPVSLQALLRAIELNGVKVAENGRAFSWGRIAIANPAAIDDLSDNAEQANDDTLDEIIERRRLFLKDYQDDKLAERYVSLVEKARTVEAGLSDGDELATAVARSYFKLLSYKDEYEVARLHTQAPFLASIRENFGPKAKLRFHLAPPFLNGETDARGRPRKKEFGAWVLPAFRLLAKMRSLRGTAFDIFGRTAERRMERALIVEFEQLVNELLPVVSAHNLDAAGELVKCFMDIRGFGPVKEESVGLVREAVAARMRELLGEDKIAA
ncbi:MAG: indolepyruvate ferredoxin oxidoreductase family protein [Gammaproteobacteria bacterium]|nr:indolepyruvate ferredoxin oxidoreductase family protein [Gammaproteobacteria bacterium]